jgi:hypothetical protein
VISIISVGMPDLEKDAGHSIIGTWPRVTLVRRLAGGYLLLMTLSSVSPHLPRGLVHEFRYDFVIGYDADTFACMDRWRLLSSRYCRE